MPVTPGDQPDTVPPDDDDRADLLAQLVAERYGVDVHPRQLTNYERGAVVAIAPESRDLL